ncbi:hypothetical protein ACT414_18635 (plasmid) [Acinetobacter baumannii]
MGWRIPEIGEKVVVSHPDYESKLYKIKSGDVGKVVGIVPDDDPSLVLLLLYNPNWDLDEYYTHDIGDYFIGDLEEACLVYIRECDLHGINESEVKF